MSDFSSGANSSGGSSKRRMSGRERWLVALLPAALILIASYAIPMGQKKAESLERVVTSAPDDMKLHRELSELSKQLKQARQERDVEVAKLEQLQADIDFKKQGGAMARSSTIDRFQQLSQRLADRGVVIMASEPIQTTGANNSRPKGAQHDAPRAWRLTVAGTWPKLREAMSDESLTPAGLRIQTLTMSEPTPGTTLRRWVLEVSQVDGRAGAL